MRRTRARKRLEGLWVELSWRRLAREPESFFRECVSVPAGEVLGQGRDRLPFELFEYQQEALAQFQRERFVVGLKARQLGWTTLVMAYALHLLLFKPGSNILLVSKDQPTANKALDLLDFMWDFLPPWVKSRAPKLEKDSATEHVWRFSNGMTSRIVSKPATKTAGAGETATLVIWDEAALARDQEDTFRTLLPTTSAGGSMIVFSTARGAHNQFARLFRQAEQGESRFKPLFHAWYVSRLMNPLSRRLRSCPSGPCEHCVDRVWYDAEKENFRDEPWRFFAEYPETADEAFRQSGRSRFPGLPPVEDYEPFPLRGYLEGVQGAVEFVEHPEGPLRLMPEALSVPEAVRSVVSVDPATGAGGDYTAMTGGWIDASGVARRVAFWHANDVEPAEAARQAALLGWLLDPTPSGRGALLVVEKQGGYGDTPIHELRHNLGYRNLYVHTYTGHRKRLQEQTYGMPMTAARRPLVVDALAKWVLGSEGRVLEGIDPLLRYELGAFVITDQGRVEADAGCHDDLVMSGAIWIYVLAEEVGASAAKAAPKGEKPGRPPASVGDIWREAEDKRRAVTKSNQRYAAGLKRRTRRHRRQRERA